MFQNMPEVIINGPADRIEGRYHYASAQRLAKLALTMITARINFAQLFAQLEIGFDPRPTPSFRVRQPDLPRWVAAQWLPAVAVDLEGRRQILAVELANRESQSS